MLSETLTLEFTANSFPSLILREDLTQTWNDISLSSLPPSELNQMLLLLDSLQADEDLDFDRDKILIVKAKDGIPQAIFAPGIFRDNEKIVIKIGANILSVSQKEDKFLVGNLIGKMNVTEAKDSSNKPYPKASVTFISTLHEEIFKLPVNLASKEAKFTAAQMEAALLKNKPIVDFLRQVSGGGIKVHELGSGEFQVKGISESEGEFGRNFRMHMADGRTVLGNLKINEFLEKGILDWSKPVTLAIGTIEEYAEGKYTVEFAFRQRLPRLSPSSDNSASTSSNSTPARQSTVTVKATKVADKEVEDEEKQKEDDIDF